MANKDGTHVDMAKYNADVRAYWNAGLVRRGSDRHDGCDDEGVRVDSSGGKDQNLERQRLFQEMQNLLLMVMKCWN